MSLNGGGSSGGSGAIRAGRAFVEMSLNDKAFIAGLNRVKAAFATVGKYVAGFGAGLVSAGASVLAPIASVFRAAVSRGVEFGRLSAKLGDTAENLSAFAYAAETTGVSLESLKDDLENWPERLSDAAKGTGEAAEAFKMLGVSAGQAAAIKQFPMTEQVIKLSEAMQGITNETDRLAILSKMFGDKGQNLNELLKLGPEGIRALMAEAVRVGAVETAEQVENARKINRAFNTTYAAIKYAVLSVGQALLPQADTIKAIAAGITNAAVVARKWIEENKEIVLAVTAGAAAAVALGGTFVAVGVALNGVSLAITGFASAAYLIANITTGVVSGLVTILSVTWPIIAAFTVAIGVVAGLLAITGELGATLDDIGIVGRDAVGVVGDAFKKIGDSIRGYLTESLGTFSKTWQGVKDAVESGDLGLAAKVAFAGLNVEFQRMTVELQKGWNGFKEFFVDGWHEAVAKVELGFNDLVDSVAKGMVSTTEEINKASRALADFLAFDELADASARWGGFWNDFLKDATEALAKIEKMLKLIISKTSLVTEGLIYTVGGFATGAHEPLRDVRRAFDQMPLVTDQLSPTAQAGSALIGQTNEAILRGIDAAIRGGTGVKTAGLNDELEQIRQANQSGIIADVQAAAAARTNGLTATEAALKAAQDELDVLIGIAEENAMAAREKLPEAAPDKRNLPAMPSGLTRGTFGVPDAAQFFGMGGGNVAQKQLDEAVALKKEAKITNEQLRDILKAIAVGGLRFN